MGRVSIRVWEAVGIAYGLVYGVVVAAVLQGGRGGNDCSPGGVHWSPVGRSLCKLLKLAPGLGVGTRIPTEERRDGSTSEGWSWMEREVAENN